MKIFLAAALACSFAAPFASPLAHAADNPWNGTWKLDVSKSHFEGTTFTYSKTSAGMWHFSDGSATNYDFAPDGKDYKMLTPEDTVAVTPDGDHAINLVGKFKGKEVWKTHEVLSADGKTLTDSNTNMRPDGTTSESSSTSTRVGSGSGFEGKWKATKVNISSPDVIIVANPGPGMVKWEIPAYKETVEGKADGSALPITGPTVSAGITMAIKLEGPKKLMYTVKMKDKTLSIGHQTLSADGKTLTDVSWSPGKETEKQTGVYIKQ